MTPKAKTGQCRQCGEPLASHDIVDLRVCRREMDEAAKEFLRECVEAGERRSLEMQLEKRR